MNSYSLVNGTTSVRSSNTYGYNNFARFQSCLAVSQKNSVIGISRTPPDNESTVSTAPWKLDKFPCHSHKNRIKIRNGRGRYYVSSDGSNISYLMARKPFYIVQKRLKTSNLMRLEGRATGIYECLQLFLKVCNCYISTKWYSTFPNVDSFQFRYIRRHYQNRIFSALEPHLYAYFCISSYDPCSRIFIHERQELLERDWTEPFSDSIVEMVHFWFRWFIFLYKLCRESK